VAMKLWGVLPKDDADNGLAAIERTMMDHPDRQILVIGYINRRRATLDDDTKANTPTVRFTAIEAILDEDDADNAAAILRDRREQRLAPGQLPFGGPPERLPDGLAGVAALVGGPDGQ